MSEEKAHSQIGASSLYRWSKCPGSVRVSKNIPSSTSKYAEEGTIAHDVASRILLKQIPPGAAIPEFENYPDMREAVRTYVERVTDLIHTDKHEKDVVLIEHRFHLKSIHPDAFGTGDAVIYKHLHKTLYVLDYKHGKGHVVEVRGNPQLKYYGLGALLSLPDLRPQWVQCEIIQPRAYHEDGPIRADKFPSFDLLDFALELKKYILATEDPNAPIVPGDHCHFCPAVKYECPIIQEKAVQAAKNVFAPQVSYDPEKLSASLDLLPAIEAWIKGVREFAYSEAQQGRPIPGYKLVSKRATRQFVDMNAVVQRLQQRFTEPTVRECYTNPELKSVAQIEKIVGKKDFTAIMGDLVSSISSGTTLVEASDPRPEAQQIGAAEVFKSLPSGEE